MKRFVSEQPDHTVALGRAIGQRVRVGDVVALDGELGAGKTQLVRGLAAGMGLDPGQVSSPTFVFVHEYQEDDDPRRPVLVHVDAYRLDGPEQLESIGFGDDLLRGAVLAVEWAPRIAAALGPDRLTVTIRHLGETRRAVTLTASGSWVARLDTIRLDEPTPQ